VAHGFLRAAKGAITTFDVPVGNVYGTYPEAISLTGTITGSFNDANYLPHGFLRAANGVTATFDAPGDVNGTFPEAISLSGEVAGWLWDANFVAHGFIRAPNGNLSTFDTPGAGANATIFPQGTYPLGIGALGTIAGPYYDANGNSYGFLRALNGKFTEFAAPGNTAAFAPFSFGLNFYINPLRVIAGTYFQVIAGNPFGGNYQVFIRALDGTITTFVAATNTPCCTWSFPTGINLQGAIVGSFNDGYTINHGFLRAPNGSITTFDAPGAGAGVGSNQGTAPLGITDLGEIMGLVIDSSNVRHGFTLAPGWSALSAAR